MTVHITKRGRRIEIRSEGPLTGLKTTVPGAYETAAGYWTVPLSIESCKLLRQKYGRRLSVSPELRRWAVGVIQSRSYMADLAASPDAELVYLPKLAPKLYKAMDARPYQRVGSRFIADNHATLEADDPGLGKTLQAMGGILEAQIPGPYLIVVHPKIAADLVWRREIIRWLPSHHRPVTLPQLRYQREHKLRLTPYTESTWLIVHAEIVLVQSWWVCHECGKKTEEGNSQQTELKCGHIRTRKTKKLTQPSFPKIFDIEWGAIIVDESHESLIKRKGVSTQRRRGLDMLKLRGDGIKIAMSGTPFDSKPHQLWGTLNWLDPVQYSAFYRWAETYWQKGGYTGYEIGEFRKDREQMLWDSLSAIAIRRTKDEVATDLPPKMEVGYPLTPNDPNSPVGIWLPMDGKQARAYEEMEKLSVTELDSGRLEAITALAELTRLKQLACAYGDIIEKQVRGHCQKQNEIAHSKYWCNDCRRYGWHIEIRHQYIPHFPSNKFDWVVNSLEEWGYPKNPLSKVVIVSFYTGILNLFRQGIEHHFKTKKNNPLCGMISGRVTSVRQRLAVIDRFNSSEHEHILMLNLRAGGSAITIDSADRMIFISETRSPDKEKQAEDRIHRVSNPRQCMYYYLRSLGTVDVGTAIVNQDTKLETHRLLDARRGVEYMRHVLDLSRNPFS